jgi:hypothetical protein
MNHESKNKKETKISHEKWFGGKNDYQPYESLGQ